MSSVSEQSEDTRAELDAPVAIVTPVSSGERIGSLDTLRGVAILGILVMNIYAFAMAFPAYFNPLLWGGSDALNINVWRFTHLFFDQRFLSIFAMLFGAGIVLMSERAEAKGRSFTGFYYRRQLWLLLIGAIHAYLIWAGDILFLYALIGMLAYLFRRLKPRTLIIIAVPLILYTLAMNTMYGYVLQDAEAQVEEIIALQEAGEAIDDEQQTLLDDWDDMRLFMRPTLEDIQEETNAYRGSYADILEVRIPFVMGFQIGGTLTFGLGRVLALMLIGMALMKLGILSLQRDAAFYRKMWMICYAVSLPLAGYSTHILHEIRYDQVLSMQGAGIPFYFASLIMALGHVGLVMWLLKTGRLQGWLARFAAVGRMALTNYLSHSIIMTTIFYGYGLGLFGSVERIGQMGFVLALIAFQLWFSSWWLQRYRFGPAEWLWRSLTYWKRQPMRQSA
ncbi:MAG: DUF418 domain-containing protein [Pseudomonadota bacterium]